MVRGTSQLGCLLWIVVLAVLAYVGFSVGRVYYAFRTMQDRMEAEAHNAAKRSDAEIQDHLVALADSLNLPDAARRVYVRRVPTMIYIWAEYTHGLTVLGVTHHWHFTPQAKNSL